MGPPYDNVGADAKVFFLVSNGTDDQNQQYCNMGNYPNRGDPYWDSVQHQVHMDTPGKRPGDPKRADKFPPDTIINLNGTTEHPILVRLSDTNFPKGKKSGIRLFGMVA